MKRFNEKEYKDLYKAYDMLPNPITKTPILKNYPVKGNFFNLLNGKIGHSIEEITSVKDFVEEKYAILKMNDKNRNFYSLNFLPTINAYCLRSYSFMRGYDNSLKLFKQRSAKIFFKDKTIVVMPTIYVRDITKENGYNNGEKIISNIFVNQNNNYDFYDYSMVEKFAEAAECKVEDCVCFYHSTSNVQDLENALKKERVIGFNGEKWKDFGKIFANFYGGNIKTIASGRIVDIEKSPKNLNAYLSYKEPKGIKKENENKNKYLSLSLSEIPYDKKLESLCGFAQNIDENISLLRVVNKDDSNKKMEDIIKIFIDKGKVTAFRKNEAGNYVKTNLSSISNWNFQIYGISDKALDKTLFRFTEDVVKDIDNLPYASALALVLGNPIIEQFYKSDAKEMILEIIHQNHYCVSLKNILKNYFGKIDFNKKSVYQKLGINKHQFKKIVEIYNKKSYNYLNALNVIKRCFSPSTSNRAYYYTQIKNVFVNISAIDNETFDKICFILFEADIKENIFAYETRNYWPNIASKVTKIYDIKTAIKIIELLYRASVTSTSELTNNDMYRTFELYNDYFNMVNTISSEIPDANKRFPAFFDVNNFKTSVESMHNLIAEIATKIKYKVEIEKFNSQVEKIDKWTFGDETFVVIRPEKMSDLTEEGIKLHHCVGGYIQRVANGSTNIMFIRKKEEVDKPFYTVEISNSGTIEQIHGSCNCNVEPGSDLAKFVQKWTKEKKLKLNSINKIR